MYDLLMAFSLGSCLPVECKPSIFKLIDKAQEPFKNGPVMDKYHQLNEMPMTFFHDFATGTHMRLLINGQQKA